MPRRRFTFSNRGQGGGIPDPTRLKRGGKVKRRASRMSFIIARAVIGSRSTSWLVDQRLAGANEDELHSWLSLVSPLSPLQTRIFFCQRLAVVYKYLETKTQFKIGRVHSFSFSPETLLPHFVARGLHRVSFSKHISLSSATWSGIHCSCT